MNVSNPYIKLSVKQNNLKKLSLNQEHNITLNEKILILCLKNPLNSLYKICPRRFDQSYIVS